MSNIVDFDGNLEQLTAKVQGEGHLVVADFYAPWCPGCRRLGQLLPGVASANEDITFLKIDIEKNEELKSHFEISSIPVVKYFKAADGQLQVLDTTMGPNTNEIKTKIANNK